MSRILSTCLKTAAIFAIYGLIVSLFMTASIAAYIACYAHGVAFLCVGFGFIYLSIMKNDEGKLRGVYTFTAILSFIAGPILLIMRNDDYCYAHKIDRYSLYLVVTLAVFNVFSYLVVYLLKYVIPDAISVTFIDEVQQIKLTMVFGAVQSFLYAACFIINDIDSRRKIWTYGFFYTLIILIFTTASGALFGYIIETKSANLESDYKSEPTYK